MIIAMEPTTRSQERALWIFGGILTNWRPHQPKGQYIRSPLWKPQPAHGSIGSPPAFLILAAMTSRDFTISPWSLRCSLTNFRSPKPRPLTIIRHISVDSYKEINDKWSLRIKINDVSIMMRLLLLLRFESCWHSDRQESAVQTTGTLFFPREWKYTWTALLLC